MNKIDLTTIPIKSINLPSPSISSRPSDHDFSTHFFAALALSKQLPVKNEVRDAPSWEQVKLSMGERPALNLDVKLMARTYTPTASNNEIPCSYAADAKKELIVAVMEENPHFIP